MRTMYDSLLPITCMTSSLHNIMRVGYAPYQRASGADGFTIETQDAKINFEVDLQRIEVSR